MGKIDQWNKTESPEINLYIYLRLIFANVPRKFNGEKNSLFNKWRCHNWIFTCKGMKLSLCLRPYTKIYSKWFIKLNVNAKA